jgi:YVTN family beta-propeller protein
VTSAAKGDAKLGSEAAGYRITSVLGRGGMSVVYLADETRLKRQVALKLIAPELAQDRRFRARFLAESELAASLDHPNVVPIFEAGETDGELFIAMRYVQGSDLQRLLDDGPLDPDRAVAVCTQVASALDAAHGRGLVHGDVKPSNVLLDTDEHVYLADFGLTRRVTEPGERSLAGLSLATPAYAAPEQIRGEEPDGRADVYSLGCLLYECLTGRPPFARESEAALLFAHLEEAPPTLPGLEAVLAKGLAKAPEERYPTAGELVSDARQALGVGIPQRDRRLVAIGIAGVVVALVAAALATFLMTRGSGETGPEGRLLRIDAATNRVSSAATVGDGPQSVAVAGRRVWVASYRDGTLWTFDPRAASEARRIVAVGRPFALVSYGGRLYVAADGPGQFTGNVSQFDAVTGARTGGLPVLACSLTSGAHGVWVAGCPNVSKLAVDRSGVRIASTVEIPYARRLTASNYRESLSGMAEGAGAVWVIGDAADRRLWRIDPKTRRITATLRLGFPPGDVAVCDGSAWLTDELEDRLVRIDASTKLVVARIPVGGGARAVACGAGSVWVGNAVDHSVSRVDPATNRVVETIDVRASPRALAVANGTVWLVGDAR